MNGSDRRKSHLFGGVIGSLITAFSPISPHAVREEQGAGSAAGLTLLHGVRARVRADDQH